MSNAKLLVVDDEAAIRRLLRVALERSGYAVVEAADARAATGALGIHRPDLVLLDLGLPDRDGLELIPLMTAAGAAVIILSAREETDEKVAALDLGADDYVTKPFDSEELLARVRTALRRRAAASRTQDVVEAGEVSIRLTDRQVWRAGAEVHLTPKEYAFLAELARFPGRVRTHAQLLRDIWGPAHEHDVEYLRVVARSLRKKLEADPAAPRLIRNEPGVGYRLMA
jgi:two-component system KDP operon response regulator KdpE